MQNKTSCHLIRSVVILVINKLDFRCAVVRFCYHPYDYRPNWTPLSPSTIINLKQMNYNNDAFFIPRVHLFLFSSFLKRTILIKKLSSSNRYRLKAKPCFGHISCFVLFCFVLFFFPKNIHLDIKVQLSSSTQLASCIGTI